MKLYVGITDYDWFRYLQAMQPEELNFWQPGGMKLFRILLSGEAFLFKQHGPLACTHWAQPRVLACSSVSMLS